MQDSMLGFTLVTKGWRLNMTKPQQASDIDDHYALASHQCGDGGGRNASSG